MQAPDGAAAPVRALQREASASLRAARCERVWD
jgi:hypothetical protein